MNYSMKMNEIKNRKMDKYAFIPPFPRKAQSK